MTLTELKHRHLEWEAMFACYVRERGENVPKAELDALTEVAHDADSLTWKLERLEGAAAGGRPQPLGAASTA